jgi:hypothetical protein
MTRAADQGPHQSSPAESSNNWESLVGMKQIPVQQATYADCDPVVGIMSRVPK